jgi:hypothetical protein
MTDRMSFHVLFNLLTIFLSFRIIDSSTSMELGAVKKVLLMYRLNQKESEVFTYFLLYLRFPRDHPLFQIL